MAFIDETKHDEEIKPVTVVREFMEIKTLEIYKRVTATNPLKPVKFINDKFMWEGTEAEARLQFDPI